MSPAPRQPSITRRQALAAGAAGTLGATSGCIQRLRNILNRDAHDTASITIQTLPTDDDHLATQIANELADNLESVGIDTDVKYLPYVELYRNVLINGDYELFVARLPLENDPDVLRPLLGSIFAEEHGWQNPYNFTDLTIDEYTETQRTANTDQRVGAVYDIVEHLTREQPFITVGHLKAIRAVYSDEFTGWDQFDPHSPLTYLGLERTDSPGDAAETVTVELAVTDARITRNFNPLSVEYRQFGTFIGLVYDPLVRHHDGELLEWLAADLEWSDGEVSTTVEVTLRDDLEWHDEEPLTPSDIAFTYEFLEDTSGGEADIAVPSPRFRGRSMLVEDAEILGDRTIVLEFGETTQAVATRALTVPILPEHLWQDKRESVDISGIDSTAQVTEALVYDNVDEPVGSGPLRVDGIATNEAVAMERFEEHFLNRTPDPPHGDLLGEGLAFDELEIQTAPSDETAIEVLAGGNLDATTARVSPAVVPRIGEHSELSLFVQDTTKPYHVGYNTEVAPFSNPNFRRIVAQLVDKAYFVETVFDGYGTPASNPLDGTGWTPEDYRFVDEDPEVPFFGAEGDVDVDATRDAFRDRGFAFNEDGELILR